MAKEVNITVRLPEVLRTAFQDALDRNGSPYSQSQVIRRWIERYVSSGDDQGKSESEELLDKIQSLKKEVEFQSRLKDEMIDTLMLMVKASNPGLEQND